ncbi:serine protease 72 precursor [Nasonia vitripennis]|uniref:chymotrypsin n=1 Tax=Nasonia vitripennis TaxID=7425 RepID=A0A7M6UWF7_NASVI|nr:serine protease 72 precursor [Nasonia vitripennis]
MLKSGLILLNLFAAIQGRVIENDNTRIVNGENVSLGEIPYQVSLQRKVDNFHFCGGSVLNKNYIITAAHCVSGTNPETIQVIVGTLNLDDPQAVYFASKITVHEAYSPSNSYKNDIALIKVQSPIKFSKTVSTVILPKANAVIDADKHAVVSGYGHLYQNGPTPKDLQKVGVLIADQQYCNNVYTKLGEKVHETHICAHDPVVEHGSCQGDSGGPLTVDGVLVGLVSWALGCAQVNYPTVFTRVSEYIDWIERNSQ